MSGSLWLAGGLWLWPYFPQLRQISSIWGLDMALNPGSLSFACRWLPSWSPRWVGTWTGILSWLSPCWCLLPCQPSLLASSCSSWCSPPWVLSWGPYYWKVLCPRLWGSNSIRWTVLNICHFLSKTPLSGARQLVRVAKAQALVFHQPPITTVI